MDRINRMEKMRNEKMSLYNRNGAAISFQLQGQANYPGVDDASSDTPYVSS